jgi:hypothetical protein
MTRRACEAGAPRASADSRCEDIWAPDLTRCSGPDSSRSGWRETALLRSRIDRDTDEMLRDWRAARPRSRS